jgi:shikimate dehydrogenase
VNGERPELAGVREDRLELAVLGDPLAYTRSPDLHRAALAAVGRAGDSRAVRTQAAELDARLHELAARGVRGVNLTHPLKEAVLPLLHRVSERSRATRSVNTVGLDAGGWWGDSTDGVGFVAWLRSLGSNPERERVVVLGAGGAARAIAWSLIESGALVTYSARRPDGVAPAWSAIHGASPVAWRSREEAAALADATWVAHATPLEDPHAIAPWDAIAPGARIVDLRYGPTPTPWVLAARAAGREAWDGLGMLVHQARASFTLWTGADPGVEPLERAVGWPR